MANSDKEIKNLEKKIKKNPDSPLFARLADLYLRDGNAEHAIEICEEGLQKHPFYVTAHLVMSRCYAAIGMNEQSKAELKRSLLFDPLTPSATKMLGDLLHEEGWENLYHDNLRRLNDMDPLNEEIMGMVAELPVMTGPGEPRDTEPAETIPGESGEEDFTIPETASEEFGETDAESSEMHEEILDAEGDLPESALASSIGGDAPIRKSSRDEFASEKSIPVSEEDQAGAAEYEALPPDSSTGGGDSVSLEGEEATVLSGEDTFAGDVEAVSPEDQLLGEEVSDEPGEAIDSISGGESAGSWNEAAEEDTGAWEMTSEETSGEHSEGFAAESSSADFAGESDILESLETEKDQSAPTDELPEGSWDTIDSGKMEEVDRILANDTEKEDSWQSGDAAADEGIIHGDSSDLDFDDTMQPVIEEEEEPGLEDTGVSFDEAGEEQLPGEEKTESELMGGEPGDGSEFGEDEALTGLETFGEDSIKSKDAYAIPEAGAESGGEVTLAGVDKGMEESLQDAGEGAAAPEIVEPELPRSGDIPDILEDTFDGMDAEDVSLELIDGNEASIPELAVNEEEEAEPGGIDFSELSLGETGEEEATELAEAGDLLDIEDTESELLGDGALTELDSLENAEGGEEGAEAIEKIIDPLEIEGAEDESLLPESALEYELPESFAGEGTLPSLPGEEAQDESAEAEIELEESGEMGAGEEMDASIDDLELQTPAGPKFEEADNLAEKDGLSGGPEEEYRLTVEHEGEAQAEEIDDFNIELRDLEELENPSLLRPGRTDDDALPGRDFDMRDEGDMPGGRERDLREADDEGLGEFPGGPRREGGRGPEGREFKSRAQDEAKSGFKRDLRDAGAEESGDFPGTPRSEDKKGLNRRDLKLREQEKPKKWLERDLRGVADEELGEFPGQMREKADDGPGSREFGTREPDELKTGMRRDGLGVEEEYGPEDGATDAEESGELSDAFATLTLGEIFIAQEQYDKAIDVYKKLKAKYPEDKKVASKLRKAQRLKRNLKKNTEDGDEEEKE